MTILLVEDSAVLRSLLRELLEQQNYLVLEARDEAEALSISRNHQGPIHVLLTDLSLPPTNSLALAQRIRLRCPDIKTIYMSVYTRDVLPAFEKDAEFLEKPFDPDTLVDLLRKVLDRA